VLGNSKLVLAEHLPAITSTVPRNKDLSDHIHLKGVQVIELPKKKKVSLIIGTDKPSAHVPSEVRRGSRFKPQALRTPFGWTVLSTGPSIDQCAFIQKDKEIRTRAILDRKTVTKKKLPKNKLSENKNELPEKRGPRIATQLGKDKEIQPKPIRKASARVRPSVKQRTWVCPFSQKKFLFSLFVLLLLTLVFTCSIASIFPRTFVLFLSLPFVWVLLRSLCSVASSMERVNWVAIPLRLLEGALRLHTNWRSVHHLTDIFWSRWQKEYLQTLQKRSKWHMPQTNVAVGDVVLLMDKRLHRSDWPKAIITKTATGPDGFVRTVRVRTSNGSEYDRDIRKLALLEAASDMTVTVATTVDSQPNDEPIAPPQLRRSERLQTNP
jgi:hypothetical protein